MFPKKPTEYLRGSSPWTSQVCPEIFTKNKTKKTSGMLASSFKNVCSDAFDLCLRLLQVQRQGAHATLRFFFYLFVFKNLQTLRKMSIFFLSNSLKAVSPPEAQREKKIIIKKVRFGRQDDSDQKDEDNDKRMR